MGIHERPGTWKARAENPLAEKQERGMNYSDLIERSRVQANNYADAKSNENLIKVFISTGNRDLILKAGAGERKMSAARKVAKENPFLIPDTIVGDDAKAAFLIALAEHIEQKQ